MVNLDSILEVAYNKFVGEIPQVYATFLHHYGEERLDLTIKCGVISNLTQGVYNNLIPAVITEGVLDTAYSESWVNKFTLVKLKSLIVDNKLTLTEETLQEFEPKTIDELFVAINTIIKKQRSYEKVEGVIMIHFPKVTVTNENNRSTDIFDLYSRVSVYPNATISDDVEFCKATYTHAQWSSRYIHSHIQSVDPSHPERFKSSCLGSGPLSRTIPSLRVENNVYLWPLFCLELERYVEVESLTGGPYIRLENISLRVNSEFKVNAFNNYYNRFPINLDAKTEYLINRFIEIIIEKKAIPFVFSNNIYTVGDNFVNTAIKLSDIFIDFYNNEYIKRVEDPVTIEDLFRTSILYHGIIEGGSIKYKGISSNNGESAINGKVLFKFKGEDIKLLIHSSNQEVEDLPIFVNHNIISSIVYNFLTFINHADKYKQLTSETTSGEDVKKGFTF